MIGGTSPCCCPYQISGERRSRVRGRATFRKRAIPSCIANHQSPVSSSRTNWFQPHARLFRPGGNRGRITSKETPLKQCSAQPAGAGAEPAKQSSPERVSISEKPQVIPSAGPNAEKPV